MPARARNFWNAYPQEEEINMKLREIHFEADYNKEYVNVVESFYNPCMNVSNRYDRITGYFASTIFYICWESIKEFIQNNGKIRIVCSPCISDEDKNAIVAGYDLKEQILKQSIVQEVKTIFEAANISSSYKALTYLIANNYLEIKIAVPTNQTPDEIKKLFHDKAGLFSDGEDFVGFRGGINETFNGWSQEGNMDSIDVFTSWEDTKDATRVQHIKEYFSDLWNKNVRNTVVYDFPEEATQIIVEHSKNYDWDELVKEISVKKSKSYKWKPNKNSSKDLRDHQLEALENWERNGRKGIFEHATGSGKTFTAICAIRDSLLRKEIPIVLVPSKELLGQWKEEIEKNIKGIENLSFLLCGDGNTSWKDERLLNKITRKVFTRKNYIIIAIMATACSNDFLSEINQGAHLFVVADEVHRLGSKKGRNFFRIAAGPRIGLSATPRRYGDPEGTKAIFDYFGGVVEPVFSLKDAIDSGVLTKYFYYPKTTHLSDEEQEEYDNLTKQIKKMVAISGGDLSKLNDNSKYKTMLLQRSRILKNASSKVDLALQIIEEYYKIGQKWIVYCDNTEQLKKVLYLLLDKGYSAFEYHSSMLGDRQETLRFFEECGGIMVSIKCLDEGVDIPSTTHALILASSKNPREFIQRRGRILRTHYGKNLAFLFDAVILPNKSEDNSYDSLLLNEFARTIQFGQWAENKTCIAKLQNIAIDFDINIDDYIEGGFDDYDE